MRFVAADGGQGARDAAVRVQHGGELGTPLVDRLQLDDALRLVRELQCVALEAHAVRVVDGILVGDEFVKQRQIGALQGRLHGVQVDARQHLADFDVQGGGRHDGLHTLVNPVRNSMSVPFFL